MIVMGICVPITLFFLLGLSSYRDVLIIAASTFLSWGVADLLAGVLERPRLRDRSPGRAFKEDVDRRSSD